MTQPTPAMRMIAGHLNPTEQQELADILDYMGEKAGPGNPSGHLPEGNIARLLNKASPRVRDVLKTIDTTMETPRVAPFAPKLSEHTIAEGYGLDPSAAVTIKSALDTMHVANGLQSRLGTDKDLPTEPLSMRDHIDAAFDGHVANDAVDNQLQHELSGAADHLDRRTAIERTFNVMENF